MTFRCPVCGSDELNYPPYEIWPPPVEVVPVPPYENQLGRPSYEICPNCGFRGELVALRWSDVDLVAGRVTIARSLTVGGASSSRGRRRRTPAVNWPLIRLVLKC